MKQKVKKYIISASVAFSAFSLVSCDGFLDVTPTDKVTSDIVFTSYENACAAMNGIYEVMGYVQGSPLSPGFVSSQALGVHNFLIASDMMGTDIIPKDYKSDQWQGPDYSFESRTTDKGRPEFFWRYCYSHINVLNDVLMNIPKLTAATTEQKKQIEGEARFTRVYLYHLLVLNFQQTYLANPNAAGVPLYTQPTTVPKQRASMSEVYGFMESELHWVIENLPSQRRAGSKLIPNKDAGKALMVRVLMDMGKYDQAKGYAAELVAAYPLMDETTLLKGMNDSQISECIWSLTTSKKNAKANYSMQTMFSHTRPFSRWTQGFVYINDTFEALFSDTDVRGKQIMENPKTNEIATNPERKYISTKICDGPEENRLPDVILMRSAEMLLAEAECAARLGNVEEATDLLYTLQKKRDPQAVKPQLTSGTILDAIHTERRKELWGEGFALTDIKRFRKPLERTGNHSFIKTLPAESKEFVFQIPSKEIQINPIEQNP